MKIIIFQSTDNTLMPEENIEDNGWLIGTFQQSLDEDIFSINLSVLQVFFHHLSTS
jgi:hypothetical protein